MAQNEMKAMRGMPLRVPSMEGLGLCVQLWKKRCVHVVARGFTEINIDWDAPALDVPRWIEPEVRASEHKQSVVLCVVPLRDDAKWMSSVHFESTIQLNLLELSMDERAVLSEKGLLLSAPPAIADDSATYRGEDQPQQRKG